MRNNLMLAAVVAAASATATPADQITLTTGETLSGTIVEQNDAAITFEHPLLGTLKIAPADVSAVVVDPPDDDTGPADAQAPAESTGDDASAVEAPAVEPARVSFFDGWKSNLELGGSGTTGNSERTNFRLAFKTTKENEEHRWLFDSSYYQATSDGETRQNELNAELNKHWLTPDKPWYWFVKGIYDYDEFEQWEHRAGGFGGVGYDLIKAKKLHVVGEVGGGATKEFSGERDLRPEGLISAGLVKWQISNSQTLVGKATVFPDFGDLGAFRAVSKIEWQIKLDHAEGVSFKLGLDNEYESEVEKDEKRNDLKFYGALVFEF